MSVRYRPDCRLHNYIEESWRNDYCWSDRHEVCPDGLPKAGWWPQHRDLVVLFGIILAVTAWTFEVAWLISLGVFG